MTDFSSLSVEQTLYLHECIMNKTGGKHGILNFFSLLSSLERCKTTFLGDDVYPTTLEKAATILQSLITNHPFVDGNKRTAYQTMKRFLFINGIKMKCSQKEISRFCISIPAKKHTMIEIVSWLKNNTTA